MSKNKVLRNNTRHYTSQFNWYSFKLAPDTPSACGGVVHFAWLSIFGGLILLVTGYTIMPSQRLSRAEEYQYGFFNRTNYEYLLKHLPKDDLYSKRVDRLNRDLKIQELKLEIEELKCNGPEEFFKTPAFNFEYVFFYLTVLIMVSYGIGFIVYLMRLKE